MTIKISVARKRSKP